MALPDLNLLLALDALLSEGSVAAAAQKMNLSSPAMSRQLARIRLLLNDPIMVRAGSRSVFTARAEGLRSRVAALVIEAKSLVQTDTGFDVSKLERTFTIRASDGFVATFGAQLAGLVAQQAPTARLRFTPEGREDVNALRDGGVDLDIGVIGAMGPEVRLQVLFRDRFIGLVRSGHPLARGDVTMERFIAFPHVSVSRRGRFVGPLDAALEINELSRSVPIAVGSLLEALAIAQASDFVAIVPDRLSASAAKEAHRFELPVPTETIAIAVAWHPRFETDPPHTWLRAAVRRVCSSPSEAAAPADPVVSTATSPAPL